MFIQILFLCIRFFAMCVWIDACIVHLDQKKVSKSLEITFFFLLLFSDGKWHVRSVTHHSTTGNVALLLCYAMLCYSLFLILTEYDDGGGAINSLLFSFHIHSFVCSLARYFILSYFLYVYWPNGQQHNMYSIKYFWKFK